MAQREEDIEQREHGAAHPADGAAQSTDAAPQPTSADQPLTDQPLTDQPLTDQPLTDQPLTNQPLTDQPLTDEAKQEERRRLATARIGERPWLPLDNASKIFLSTMSNVDTKVFRITAGLAKLVRPDLLQEALDSAYDSFPMYHGIIRRGTFWYFIERSDLRPEIAPENDIPCAQIFTQGYRGLLFRVLYRANRIHLEVFHALSDGNGAISFFQLLLITYLRLCRLADGQTADTPLPHYIASDSAQDSFTEFFSAKAAPSNSSTTDANPSDTTSTTPPPKLPKPKEKVYHVKGRQTTDGRMNILELHLRTSKVLTTARAAGGTLTTYLSAIFMQAIYDTMPPQTKAARDWQFVLSVPVDLRQFYPSLTSRNFFATVMLRYVFQRGREASLAEITAELSENLRQEATKERISAKAQSLVKLEQNIFLRLTPLYLKDAVLRLANHVNNRGITASMTNVGRFRMPGEIQDDLQEAIILTSAVRPQFSVQSYDNDLSITFTSPKMSTAIQDRYREILEEQGLTITFAVESIAPEGDGNVYKTSQTAEVVEEVEAAEAAEAAEVIEGVEDVEVEVAASPEVVSAALATSAPVTPDAPNSTNPTNSPNPAAGQVTDDIHGRTSAKYPPYPTIPVETNLPFMAAILTASTIFLMVLYSIGNLLWNWQLPVATILIAIATIWIVVMGILRNLHNPAWSILRQTMILAVGMVLIDWLSGWSGWSLTWAIPFIFTGSIIATQITLLASRKALERGVFFLQIEAILALLPALFILLRLVSPTWPSWMAVGVGTVSFIITAIWRRKILGEEVKRKLHF